MRQLHVSLDYLACQDSYIHILNIHECRGIKEMIQMVTVCSGSFEHSIYQCSSARVAIGMNLMKPIFRMLSIEPIHWLATLPNLQLALL